MGAWGPGSFQNDDALEFVAQFEDAPSWETVLSFLVKVAEAGAAYVEAPEAGEAVAAAEIVAARMGAPALDLPQEVAILAMTMIPPPPQAVDAARRAVVRVMDNSELAQLWSQDEARGIGQTSPDWLQALEDLLGRLRPDAA